MPALFFGSISTLADTSELQRAAFNQAFADAGLDWTWSQEEYRTLLTSNGGADRITAYAAGRGETVDAAALHAAKSTAFQKLLGSSGVTPRPGVVDTIRAAREAGWQVGLVTTTSEGNVAALLAALAPDVDRSSFAVVVDATDVEAGKPDPAAYLFALRALGSPAGEAVAVEDNEGGVAAAVAAGVACVAFPNENTVGHDFAAADRTVDRLDLGSVRS